MRYASKLGATGMALFRWAQGGRRRPIKVLGFVMGVAMFLQGCPSPNPTPTPVPPVSGQDCSVDLNNKGAGQIEADINGANCAVVTLSGQGKYGINGDLNQTVEITKANVTIRGTAGAAMEGLRLNVLADSVTIENLTFRVSASHSDRRAHVDVGCNTDYTGCSPVNVNGTSIKGNHFSGLVSEPGVRVNSTASHRVSDTHILENTFSGFAGTTTHKAIQVGSDQLANGANQGYLIAGGTIVRDNLIVANKELGNGGSAGAAPAIQLFFPTVVENNCIANASGISRGFSNGISAKGSGNTIVGNTISGTHLDGGVYGRDGDLNVWAYNLVSDNARGLYMWSGQNNIYVRNTFENNTSYGQLVWGGESGQRQLPGLNAGTTQMLNTFGTSPFSARSETSSWFAPVNPLVTQNVFTWQSTPSGLMTSASSSPNGTFAPQGAWLLNNSVKNTNGSTVMGSGLVDWAQNPANNGSARLSGDEANAPAVNQIFNRTALQSIFDDVSDPALRPTRSWLTSDWDGVGAGFSAPAGVSYGVDVPAVCGGTSSAAPTPTTPTNPAPTNPTPTNPGGGAQYVQLSDGSLWVLFADGATNQWVSDGSQSGCAPALTNAGVSPVPSGDYGSVIAGTTDADPRVSCAALVAMFDSSSTPAAPTQGGAQYVQLSDGSLWVLFADGATNQWVSDGSQSGCAPALTNAGVSPVPSGDYGSVIAGTTDADPRVSCAALVAMLTP